MKQSQSASDITVPEAAKGGYDSEEDSLQPKGTLSSRALSHDSIFLADQAQSSSEPTRVLSQDNVHSRIRALQTKLQQQNFHLGPPPLLVPSKRMEDAGATSEDDGLPHSPPEIAFQDSGKHISSYKRNHSCLSLAGTGSEEEEQVSSQPPSRPLSPWSHLSHRPCSPMAHTATSSPSSPTADFSSPAQFTPCLDTSAARHRVSVKPRNQRPSTKARNLLTSVQRPRSESMHDLVQVLSEGEEEMGERSGLHDEKTRFRSHSTQILMTERENLIVHELQTDRRKQNTSLDLQEEPGPEDPLPRSSSTLTIGEDEDPEQTASETHVTSNPLFLLPMPEHLQPEPFDMIQTRVPQSTLPELTAETLEQSVDMECSGDEEQDKFQEEAVDLTEPHKQLEITEKENLSDVIPVKLESETPPEENEQSVDGPAYEYRPTQDVECGSTEERRKSPVRDISTQPLSQADSPIKYQPVAALRVRKPPTHPSHSASLKRRTEASATEIEKEIPAQPEVVLRARVTPAGQESQVSINSEKCRPNSGSFHFSLSSAQRRSKIANSGEWNTTNPEEVRKPVEQPAVVPLNNKDTPGKHSSQPEEKTKEFPQKHQFAPEKRSSLRREIVPNSSVTRTMDGKTDGHVRKAKGPDCQDKADEKEEKTNAFGVTLRSTSLSLKYRSEAAQSEARYKRHSLETSNKTTMSEDLPGQHIGTLQSSGDRSSSTLRTESTNKSFVVRKNSSLKSGTVPTATSPTGSEDLKSKDTAATTRQQNRGSRSSLGSAEGLNSESPWKSDIWDKAKGLLQPLTNQPAPEAPTADTTTRHVQLRSLQKATSSISTPPKLAAKPSTVTPAPKPPARDTPDRPGVPWVTDKTNQVQRRCDGANMAEETVRHHLTARNIYDQNSFKTIYERA
ncbi:hypothetical protein ACEWY4_016270 [Coilia grayii]|uniref:DUF4592 domain-containing protein n=1 Tax=Coilia grayii TaxID=363190 RepID=A0ABD1JJY8_9TELE